MKPVKIVSMLIGIFILMPIWFYLLYVLLKHAEVDRLVWFLYIVYMPLSMFVKIIMDVFEKDN